MNKNEFVDRVAERLETNRKAAADAVEAVFDTIKSEVAKGERVAISGFGIFEQIQRKARTARNPFDGSLIKVNAKAVPKFKPGADFKAFVENPVEALKKARDSAKAAPAKAGEAATGAAKKTTEAAKKTSAAAKSTASAAKKTTASTAKKASTAAKSTASSAGKTTSTATKKAPAKKASTAKKAPAKKTTAKKTTAKKAPAKKATT